MFKQEETPILGASREVNATGLQPAQVINNEERAHASEPIMMSIEELTAYDQWIQGLSKKSKRKLRPPMEIPKPSEDNSEMKNLKEGVEILKDHMKFDAIKIAIPYGNLCPIEVLNPDAFNCKTINGLTTHYFKDPKTNLCIRWGDTKYNCEHREVTMDIPASILREYMMELISIDNIRTILRLMDTKYNLIRIKDIEKFIRDAYVVSCDVTKDVSMNKSFAKQIADYTINNCKNTRSTHIRLFDNGNFYIHNNVNAKSKCKERLTIYDKYRKLQEMRKDGLLPEGLDIEMHRDRYRIELNLSSTKKIKERLQIPSNGLLYVLNSKAQPFLEIYRKYVSFRKDPQQLLNKKKEYITYLIAKDCGFDLRRIEMKLRQLYKSWSTSRLVPYQKICTRKTGLKADMAELGDKIKNILTINYTRVVKIPKRESFPIL